MTMKTKRRIAIGGGTVFCAALAVLIATRFAPNDKPIATSTPEPTSSVQVNVQISTSKRTESKPTEKTDTDNLGITDSGISSALQITSDPDKEAKDFINSGGIEVRQDFPKTENSQTSNNSQTENNTNSAPTEAPKVTDEKALTDYTKEPTYDYEQTVVTLPDNTNDSKINPAMHGQKKDGMIFITGFGWVKDNGGGGRAEYDSEMYENGNKIGSFG